MPQQKIRCNHCYWIGNETALKTKRDDDLNFNECCPNCFKHDALMDLNDNTKFEIDICGDCANCGDCDEEDKFNCSLSLNLKEMTKRLEDWFNENKN